MTESDHSLVEIPPDAEWRLPDFHPSMATLLDYFPTSPFVVMDRPITLAQHAREWEERLHAAWEEHRHGRIPNFRIRSRLNRPAPGMNSCPSLPRARFWRLTWVAPADDTWNPVITLPFQSAKSMGLGLRGTSFTETLSILETASP